MKKVKKTIGKKIIKKIMQIMYLLIKPFIPYIALFLFIFFFIILIIDAIFIQFSNDETDLDISEKDLQTYCESASALNYDIYIDGEKTTDNNVSSNETIKAITWEQIYSLLLFHNIADNKEITNELASQIANDFKSKYYYKTSTVITEKKITDDKGNISWEKQSEEQTRLIIESITISGHYKYNYMTEITEERRYKNY